jgi:hypothetical protein
MLIGRRGGCIDCKRPDKDRLLHDHQGRVKARNNDARYPNSRWISNGSVAFSPKIARETIEWYKNHDICIRIRYLKLKYCEIDSGKTPSALALNHLICASYCTNNSDLAGRTMNSHSTIYPRITDFDDGSVTNSGPPSPPTTTVLGLANMHIHPGLHSTASSVSLASAYESVVGSVASGSSGSSSSRPVACDTVPPPQKLALRRDSSSPQPVSPPALFETSLFDVPVLDEAPTTEVAPKAESSGHGIDFAPPGRKLCVRHQRMADQGLSSKLQRVSVWLPQAILECR